MKTDFLKSKTFEQGLKILIAIILLLFCFKKSLTDGDFKVFLEAAKLLSHGETPYDKWIFVNEGSSCLYFYSPIWAIILIPFSYFSFSIANFIWLVLNLFFTYRSWVLISEKLNFNQFSKRKFYLFLFLAIFCTIRFWLYNFDMIQMTIFLLWGCLESMKLFENKNYILGALVLSLVINIKIMPIVFIPYLICRNEIKALVFTLIFSVLLLYLPVIFFGWEFNQTLLNGWWASINPNNSEHLLETDLGTHGLTSLLPNLLSETSGDLPIKRNILNLAPETSILITNLVRLGLVASFLLILKSLPFTKVESDNQSVRELSYLLLLIPIIFPHQQKYAYFLILPSVLYILDYLFGVSKDQRDTRWNLVLAFMVISFLLMTGSTDGFIGRDLNNITQHFKTITIGALFLLANLHLIPRKEH